MPLTRVRFAIDGDVQFSRAFELMASEADDLTDPLTGVGDIIVRSVERQFESEGAAGLGSRWEPLDRAYGAWKRTHFPGSKILHRTGRMESLMTSRQVSVRVTRRRMVYEPPSDVAGYHQRGDGALPARKMVALSGATRREIDREFVEWVSSLRRGPLRSR